jgi:hypothetical protein
MKYRTKKLTAVSEQGMVHHIVALLIVVAFGVGGVGYYVESHAATPTTSTSTATTSTSNCTVAADLVNSCRPWLGTVSSGYSQAADSGTENTIPQVQYFNDRLNNSSVLTNASQSVTDTYKADYTHWYNQDSALSSAESTTMDDSSLYGSSNGPAVFIDFNPGGNFANVISGSDDASLIASAKAIKAVGRPVFLTMYHETEDKVNATGQTITGSCKTPAGGDGSAAQFVQMWQHVVNVFNQQGATNVQWVMDYEAYLPNWSCIENSLWPGNNYVNWVMWDPYGDGGGTQSSFSQTVTPFYNWLTQNSNATHDYLSKPWGLGEVSTIGGTDAQDTAFWQNAQSSIGTSWSTDQFPLLKAITVYDTNLGPNNPGGGARVGYDASGALDVAKQTAFNGFAQSLLNFKPPTPTLTISTPANNAIVSGTIPVTGTPSELSGVDYVSLRVDNKFVTGMSGANYTLSLNTKKLTNGTHTLVLRAWDSSTSHVDTTAITINVQN